jgi:hypothetical protein
MPREEIAATEGLRAIEGLTSDAKFHEGVKALTQEIPDPIQYLENRGVTVPEGAEITIHVNKKKPDPPDKCITICVGPPFAKVCYRWCT